MLAGTGETTHIIHYTTGACSFDYVISEYDIPGCNICKQGVTLCHCEDSSCIPWFKDVLNGLSTSFFFLSFNGHQMVLAILHCGGQRLIHAVP